MESIRLDEGAIEIQGAQKLFQRCALAGFVGVVGLLSQRDPKGRA